MKIYILSLFFLFSVFISHAQVGINTNNPQTTFHIDGLGNNPSDIAPSTLQQSDDMALRVSAGSVNLGIGIIPNETSRAQVELNGANSAFIPNRIPLKSLTDITTIPNPIAGMIVYNTTDNSAIGLTPGLYYFSSDKWSVLYSSEAASTIEYRDLAANVTPTRNSNAYQNPNFSAVLTWKDPENPQADASSTITLPETGSFAFSFRLYISQSANGVNRGVFYLWAMKGSSTSTADVLDAAELNIPIFNAAAAAQFVTYSVTLAVSGTKGDQVTFRFGSPLTSAWPSGNFIAKPRTSLDEDPNPERTSLIFWKL